jgi:hypothetical protein
MRLAHETEYLRDTALAEGRRADAPQAGRMSKLDRGRKRMTF